MKAQKVAFIYGVVIFIIFYFSEFHYYWDSILSKNKTNKTNGTSTETIHHNKPRIKYILQWRKPIEQPDKLMKVGQETFYERNCAVNNCYITWNRTQLSNLSDYDAVLFYCQDVTRRGFLQLYKRRRSHHQKYVFVCTESPANYPVGHGKYNGFFNMTWTFKLDSDVSYGYLVIKDGIGKIIGPKKVMHWLNLEDMKPIDNKLREKLNSKKTAAAWFVSHCNTRSRRKKVALKIKEELAQHNMTLDIYGECGNKTCPRSERCLKMLENDYYFYLSFENSINEDYVTEKLLNPLQHYTVPIVYGGANYTRYMPDGIYLNARSLPVKELVKQMVDVINDKKKYSDFFRWRSHYSYHYINDAPETDPYCNFCEKINDPRFMNHETVRSNLVLWWNGWNVGDKQVLYNQYEYRPYIL